MAGTRELKQKIGDIFDDTISSVGRRAGRATSGRSRRQREEGPDRFEERSRETDQRIASQYASRDHRRPGNHPPSTPPESYDPANGVSGWQHRNRGEHRWWMDYEQQVAGTDRVDGRNPEWMQIGPGGRPVAFDGHTTRGNPPVEVFLEAKNGYARLFDNPEWASSQNMASSLVAQARRQMDALPDGAVLEWHVSNPRGAEAIADLLADAGLGDVVVRFTSRV